MNRKDRVIVCYLIRNKHTSEGFHNLALSRRYLTFHLSKVNLRGTLYLSSGTCSYLSMVASVCRSELGIPWADWTHQSFSQQVWTSWITATWRSHPWPSASGLEWLLPGVQIFLDDPASLCHYSDERKKEIWEIWTGFPFFILFLHQYYPWHNLKRMLHQKRMKLILLFTCSS